VERTVTRLSQFHIISCYLSLYRATRCLPYLCKSTAQCVSTYQHSITSWPLQWPINFMNITLNTSFSTVRHMHDVSMGGYVSVFRQLVPIMHLNWELHTVRNIAGIRRFKVGCTPETTCILSIYDIGIRTMAD
jgi:hypothetical protein